MQFICANISKPFKVIPEYTITRPKVCIMISEFMRILPFLPTLLGTALSQRWALAGDSIPELYFFVLSWIILRLILIFVALLTKPKLFIAKKKNIFIRSKKTQRCSGQRYLTLGISLWLEQFVFSKIHRELT